MNEERLEVGGETWLWLRDGSAEPAADALERLLEMVRPPGGLPRPVLLCSKVVGPDGALVEALAPWYRRDDAALAIEAAGHGLLPIRAARTASVLVREDVAGPSRDAGLEWTASVLRGRVGFLVPGSVAVAAAPPAGPVDALDADALRDLGAGARLLAGRAFTAREKLWLGLEVATRGAGAARRAALGQASRRSRG